MTKYVELNAVLDAIGNQQDGTGMTFEALSHAMRDVMSLKQVDAVPVIRCKDCRFSKAYYHGSESNLGMFTYLCTQGLYGMNADDYCSRAERKEE